MVNWHHRVLRVGEELIAISGGEREDPRQHVGLPPEMIRKDAALLHAAENLREHEPLGVGRRNEHVKPSVHLRQRRHHLGGVTT